MCLPFLILCAALSSSTAHAQNLPLYRIAYGTTGENPTALWIGLEQGFYRRLSRIEEAESGYNSLLTTYVADLRPNADGVNKIHKILSKANPKLEKIKPEEIIDDSTIKRIHESGY